MMLYSIEPGDLIFIKSCGILSFDKIVGKQIGKNVRKHICTNSQIKLLEHLKQSEKDAFKTDSKIAMADLFPTSIYIIFSRSVLYHIVFSLVGARLEFSSLQVK